MEITGRVTSIEYEHQLVHAGFMFFVSDYDTDVDILAPKYWHFKGTAGRGQIHFEPTVGGSAGALVELYEAPTLSANGTALAVINMNRLSGRSAPLSAWKDPTVSADGTFLGLMRLGAGGNPATASPGQIRPGVDWVLKEAVSYLLKVTPDSDNTEIDLSAEVYEQVGKEQYSPR